MALNEAVVDAVTNANFKNMAEMLVADVLAHRQRLSIIAETALTKNLEALHNTSVAEGLGISAAQRGDLSKQITELLAALASGQQKAKVAQSTPPETATG